MNPTHIHLVISHLPIFGTVLGAVVLAYAIFAKSKSTQIAAYILFIISSLGAGIAYLTGEEAEETVEGLPGVAESAIEQHEEFALFALVSLIVLGVAAIVSIIIASRKKEASGGLGRAMLALSFISFGMVARTGFLGGQIRHTEIHSSAPDANGSITNSPAENPAAQPARENEEEEDD